MTNLLNEYIRYTHQFVLTCFYKIFFLTGRMKTLYGFINGLWKPLIYSDGLRCFCCLIILFWLTRSAQLSINETLHVKAKLFELKRWYFLRYFVGLLCLFWIKKHKRVGYWEWGGLPYLWLSIMKYIWDKSWDFYMWQLFSSVNHLINFAN